MKTSMMETQMKTETLPVSFACFGRPSPIRFPTRTVVAIIPIVPIIGHMNMFMLAAQECAASGMAPSMDDIAAVTSNEHICPNDCSAPAEPSLMIGPHSLRDSELQPCQHFLW